MGVHKPAQWLASQQPLHHRAVLAGICCLGCGGVTFRFQHGMHEKPALLFSLQPNQHTAHQAHGGLGGARVVFFTTILCPHNVSPWLVPRACTDHHVPSCTQTPRPACRRRWSPHASPSTRVTASVNRLDVGRHRSTRRPRTPVMQRCASCPPYSHTGYTTVPADACACRMCQRQRDGHDHRRVVGEIAAWLQYTSFCAWRPVQAASCTVVM